MVIWYLNVIQMQKEILFIHPLIIAFKIYIKVIAFSVFKRMHMLLQNLPIVKEVIFDVFQWDQISK
jgi:hypothetical protein